MCSPDVLQKLEQTVREFLDQGRMFTGYDVTIETRERERMQLRHESVNADIHEISILTDAVEFGHDNSSNQTVRWGKSQVNMPNGKWAFVYHPSNVDPNGYHPRGASTSVSIGPPTGMPIGLPVAICPAPALSASVTDSVSDSGGQNADGSFQTDYRGRLFIRTEFLREVGLNAGDMASVVADQANKKIYLVSDPSNFQGAVSTQMVERKGHLRLSSATLKTADLTASKYVITNGNHCGQKMIEIIAAP